MKSLRLKLASFLFLSAISSPSYSAEESNERDTVITLSKVAVSAYIGFLLYQRNHYFNKDIYPHVTGTTKITADSFFAAFYCLMPAYLGSVSELGERREKEKNFLILWSGCVVGVGGGVLTH